MPLVCEPSVCAGGLRRPLPCVHSAVESPLSILLATSDHRCGVSGGSREEPHGEEPSVSRAGGSLVAPVRRERPWARFHNHNHPPKRSHCHRAPGGPRVWPHRRTAIAAGGARPRRRTRDPGHRSHRRREHPRRSSAGNTLTTYVTARLSTPTRLQNSTDERTRTCAYRSPRIDRGRTL